MDEHIKVKKVINAIIIGVIVIILIIVSYFIYKKFLTDKNTDDFSSYLLENNYKENSDGTYTKTETTGNKVTNYLFSESDFVLSKEITYSDDNGNTNILLTFHNDNTIETSLNLEGISESGSYGSTLQTSTYTLNDSKFECKIIIDKGFGSKCKELKNESESFAKEIEEILNRSNTKAKYIKEN